MAPNSVKGSSTTSVKGTVGISSAAPAGGVVVTLTSSNTAAATVPKSVTIPAGKTTATFVVAHVKVPRQETITLQATYNKVSQTTQMLVTP